VADVRSGGLAAARADLAGLGDLDRLLADGAVQLLSFQDVYGPPGDPVDPERAVAAYAAATERALAAGFRGLRVGVDATDLAGTPEEQDALARYEFLVDGYMATHPLSALCGYDLGLGNDTVTDVASLHSAGPSGGAAFRVFGCDDGAVGLAGEFDPVSVRALERVLARLQVGADTGSLAVDLADVDYADHRVLLALTDYARAHGVALSMRSTPPLATRLMDLMPASYLRLAEAGVEA
jgi:anti-anti-sigma regulatory factor